MESTEPIVWGSIPSFPTNYFKGQGDLVTRLTMGIIRAMTWEKGVINLLTKFP